MNNSKKTSSEVEIITYEELLNTIESSENHLLVGNGFNYGLGINTGYPAIFEEMMNKRNSLYEEIRPLVNECNNDLELVIGKLTEQTEDEYLRKFITNKIKLDFMEATQTIVKKSIKNVYADQNDGVFLLLKNFLNFFTLNYDSFLYILLLNFKKSETNENSLAITTNIKFIEDDLNRREENIYEEIKKIRKDGTLDIELSDDTGRNIRTSLSSIKKSYFVQTVKYYGEKNNKGWKDKDIKRVVNLILEEEKRNKVLDKVEDGFVNMTLFDDEPGKEFIYDSSSTIQNLFFLHGAFHIYKNGKHEMKITQDSDKALYEKLEEIINTDGQDIITVFKSSGKKEIIDESNYLKNCCNKLREIKGSLVIIGCSMSENDNHIFENINSSNINTLYISAFRGNDAENKMKISKKLFPNKKIVLFDTETISYKLV